MVFPLLQVTGDPLMPMSDWLIGLGNMFVVAFCCGIFAFCAYRWVIVPRNVCHAANELGLVFERESFAAAAAWGTAADGRKVNIYTRMKRRKGSTVFFALTALPLPWRRTDFVDVGLYGPHSIDLPEEDRRLLREYAQRALDAAVSTHQAPLAAARMRNIRIDKDGVHVEGVKFGGSPANLATAVATLIEVTREVEDVALRELAEIQGKPIPTATVTVAPSNATETKRYASIAPAPESIVCPHCDARTPTETGRCQMCGQALNSAAGSTHASKHKAETITCPQCGARTPTDTGRCQMCGKPFDDTAAHVAPTDTDEKAAPIAADSMRCPHCDARTPTETGRCQMCGERLDAPVRAECDAEITG